MNEAATQDVREMTLEPVLSKVLHGGRAPNARDAQMLALLDAWHRQGGSRLDRTGEREDHGAGCGDHGHSMAAARKGLGVVGARSRADPAVRQPRHAIYDQPPSGQYTGWHIYMYKDLRTLLGDSVRGKYAVRYCGAGT